MKKMFSAIERVPEFNKDLKKIRKKFKTIDDDLQTFIGTQLVAYHKLRRDNKGIFRLSDLKIGKSYIYKAKKFACRSLKGTGSHSGIRVVYAYFQKEDRIVLLEIYYKGDKKNEDRRRIRRYCKTWDSG
ncbi:hypothetical protein AMJ87_02545 [candidate division WOR_3 bacterium SM23_60]|uniref:Addiction module toxin RelE n=1 Tax=candidate division WOR_3 bacterium SM23_60 TaxID=1703780 RepID=A0A0S8GMS4_UNCW3|nr:MAG: hypothetical protein AMJ87_02545 [candidate division WOR_3 bacterium SM23_60]